jgi:hypothetical protein
MMKNWEVAIIVTAVALIALLWYKNSGSGQTANPTNATSAGYTYSNVYGQPLGIGPV